jgi:hypothetical protein
MHGEEIMRGPTWKTKELAVLRNAHGKFTCEEVSQQLGRTYSAVQNKARQIKVTLVRKTHRKTHKHPSPEAYEAALLEACNDAGVSYLVALRGLKTKSGVVARWKAWKRLRDEGFSFPGIGAACGYDHTSVLNGIRNLEVLGAHGGRVGDGAHNPA